MNIELTALEARVIGCLIEKQITTPDQYPLSLNALMSACNQKTNRDPVLDLDERAVQQIVDALIRKHMVIERSGFGSRVPKYQHVFCNSEFGSLQCSPLETAIVCELLLRGPQTPGELRARAARMCAVSDVGEVEAALNDLTTRQDGPYVARLAREPGRRESRFAQLFTGVVEAPLDTADNASTSARADADTEGDETRLTRLEKLVDQLVQEVSYLKHRMSRD